MKVTAATAIPAVQAPTVVDIFSGAGGMAEGFRQAGYAIRSGSDIDPAAAETFIKNFPEAVYFQGDIAELGGRRILSRIGQQAGELDCLIGGPPCQAFSYNSHLRTTRGTVAGLFREYVRLVKELRPKFIVMENVPGILSIGSGRVVGEIASSLGVLGYEATARIVYAEDFGVPQERRRVIFIASRIGLPADIFPAGTHGPAPKPESNDLIHRWERSRDCDTRKLVRVWSAIGDLPGESCPFEQGLAPTRYRTRAWSEFQRYARNGTPGVLNHFSSQIHRKLLTRIRWVPQGGSWRDIPRRLLPDGMKRANKSDHTKRYGRLAREDLACTILTKCDPHWGCYVHPEQDRVLTVREAARLQSFPDRFTFTGTRIEQYRQVGNSVPPLLAHGIARAIFRHVAPLQVGAGPTQQQCA